MKVVLALALFASSASAVFYSASLETQKYMWEDFKEEYNRVYSTMEDETAHYNVFLANLQTIDQNNMAEAAAGGTAVYGINKFTDMSPEEFKRRYLNYVPSPMENRTFAEISDLPQGVEVLVDWTGKYTTPVKNQGYCGSCWAFSATEQIESDYMRTTGRTYILSAQQVTSCTPSPCAGCNGGYTENAFTYAKNGIEQDSNYPYTSGTLGVTGSCKSSSSLFVVKTTSYTTVSSSASGESKMATYVSGTGPLSVCVDAATWSSYTGGIMSTCGKMVDHCVQAVGINTASGYWKVRNSWGTSWGESGFIRLSYGANTCAIASDANYASVATY
jgi:C1A family cysteine protease